jgi:hypothetical protein
MEIIDKRVWGNDPADLFFGRVMGSGLIMIELS